MELVKIRLENFRAYENFEIDLSKGLQMFVGKNDIGKSTIFEALDIFFNDKDAIVKISADDLNIKAKRNNNLKVSISCCFSIQERDKFYIETIAVNLKDEHLLNRTGNLEVIKEWDFAAGNNPKFVSYLNCWWPKGIPAEILTAKQVDLKKKVKELGIEKDVNLTENSSMRTGIFEALKTKDLIYSVTKIPTKNMLSEKDILENISKSFPDYYLFKADRKNSTSDDEIQNPMSIAVKRAFETDEVQSKIQEIEEIIRNQLNQVNYATIEKLKKLDIDYGSKLDAKITSNWAGAVKNDIFDGNDIPINKRGSGIRRLLLLCYLMVEAEKKSYGKEKKNIIFAIEEPETALHPYMQKKFIEQLFKLSRTNRCEFGYEMPTNTDELNRYQVFITTHLPNFISYAQSEQIIYLYKTQTGNIERYQKENLIEFIQKEMGKIPVIDYKYVIFVEGDNDVCALKNLGDVPELKNIFNINDENINIVPLIGGNLLKCIELNYFWELNVKQFHLYDGDIEKYKTKIIDKKCNLDSNKLVRGTVTKLKEMEKYIPKSLIENKLGLNLDKYSERWNDVDFNIVDVLLAQDDTSVQQFNAIKKIPNIKEKEKSLKSYLNKTVLKGVTKEMLVEHGVYDEIESWFKAFKELLEYTE